jgi:peroxiredoxin
MSNKTARSARSKKSSSHGPAGSGRGRAGRRASARRPSGGLWVVLGVGLAIAALGILYLSNRSSPSATGGSFAFEVGQPGPGAQAPDIRLDSTVGGTFDLESMRGETVLLYFQEGLTCQPCWDQLVDIQKQLDGFTTLGIDEVVSITTDPIDQIQQKVSDEGITEPVLSDPDLAVSTSYHANSFGMMGDSRDGHTFIVVGPDGTILWRADYGGAPDYTMYLPVDALIADIQRGLRSGS